MRDDEPIPVYYPVWMKVISWLGVPVLLMVALWLIRRALWEEGLSESQILVNAAMGGALLYQCAIGFLVLRYMGASIFVLQDGLEIHSSHCVRFVPWERFGRMKEYAFATTTCLVDDNGDILLYAFDNMRHFAVIKERLHARRERA